MKAILQDILTEEFLSTFQESFAYATGFGVVFVDLDGNHIGKGSNFSKFCAAINNTEEGANYCANTNKKAIDLAVKSGNPSIYVCHAGLINIEIPLTYEGEYIGAITAGQVLCSDMTGYPADDTLSEIPWLKTDEAKEYFSSIKVLTKKQIEATAISLENFTNYIIQNTMYHKLQENLYKEKEKNLEYERKQIEMDHQLKLSELDALQKQSTPHFMFNVLNSISRLIAMKSYDRASGILDSFVDMLRYSLYNINSQITLEEELSYIKNYLAIQTTRFSDRIDYDIYVEEETLDLKIPYFSLQPLVENAIEHGLFPLSSGGNVRISCKKVDNIYNIEIEDNGIGFNEKKLKEVREKSLCDSYKNSNKHVGIYNCYRRFKLMYEKNFEFSIESNPDKGSKITINIFS